MIKLFSLIFYLCPILADPSRGDVYVVNPTSTSKSKAQTQFRNQIFINELMSHLLCLNSRDNYPNKCPHICLHLTVKQHLTARGRVRPGGIPRPRRRIIRIGPHPARAFTEIFQRFKSAPLGCSIIDQLWLRSRRFHTDQTALEKPICTGQERLVGRAGRRSGSSTFTPFEEL